MARGAECVLKSCSLGCVLEDTFQGLFEPESAVSVFFQGIVTPELGNTFLLAL